MLTFIIFIYWDFNNHNLNGKVVPITNYDMKETLSDTLSKIEFKCCKVKLGYNDHGYNEFKAITSKKMLQFLAPIDHFAT